jgi:hypothetical protein
VFRVLPPDGPISYAVYPHRSWRKVPKSRQVGALATVRSQENRFSAVAWAKAKRALRPPASAGARACAPKLGLPNLCRDRQRPIFNEELSGAIGAAHCAAPLRQCRITAAPLRLGDAGFSPSICWSASAMRCAYCALRLYATALRPSRKIHTLYRRFRSVELRLIRQHHLLDRVRCSTLRRRVKDTD